MGVETSALKSDSNALKYLSAIGHIFHMSEYFISHILSWNISKFFLWLQQLKAISYFEHRFNFLDQINYIMDQVRIDKWLRIFRCQVQSYTLHPRSTLFEQEMNQREIYFLQQKETTEFFNTSYVGAKNFLLNSFEWFFKSTFPPDKWISVTIFHNLNFKLLNF